MTKRMLMATIALVGAFIAAYLTLYKIGIIGTLVCTSSGSCETVQTSRWATFLGLPVAAWGIGFYVVVFALALYGTSARGADARWISLTLVALTGWGLVFSLWLTWLELFVIHAICPYCVTSAILVAILFATAIVDSRETGAMRAGVRG